MAFEEEVFPLMVFGVLAVSGLETALGWRILRGKPHTRSKLLGHVLWMLAGFFFLFRCVFANRMGVLADIWSIHNSVCKRGLPDLPGGRISETRTVIDASAFGRRRFFSVALSVLL